MLQIYTLKHVPTKLHLSLNIHKVITL